MGISKGESLHRRPSDFLPHGEHFLFVDEILSIERHVVTASRQVPLEEPWTSSHFPGNPIVPGVLILEGMIQACGILARVIIEESASSGERHRHGTLASVQFARFRQVVRPGALLIYRATLTVKAGSLFSFKAVTSVGGEDVADAQICVSINERT
jgi:3-hydroxyacyl-[acyl-carrier-protein] dehydratase